MCENLEIHVNLVIHYSAYYVFWVYCQLHLIFMWKIPSHGEVQSIVLICRLGWLQHIGHFVGLLRIDCIIYISNEMVNCVIYKAFSGHLVKPNWENLLASFYLLDIRSKLCNLYISVLERKYLSTSGELGK